MYCSHWLPNAREILEGEGGGRMCGQFNNKKN